MVNGVSAIPAASAAPVAASAAGAGLEGQLAKYEVQLADWVHCPSCNTPEGKAKIAELTSKISAIKQNIEAADAAKRGSAPASDQPAPSTPPRGAASASPKPVGPLGNRLDLFA